MFVRIITVRKNIGFMLFVIDRSPATSNITWDDGKRINPFVIDRIMNIIIIFIVDRLRKNVNSSDIIDLLCVFLF